MKIGKLNTDSLLERVSPATLGLFRILSGLIMLVQLERLENYIVYTLTFRKFFLTFDFFHWVKILPLAQMEILWIVLQFASVCVLLGVLYRPAIAILTVGWTYILFLDDGHYNNHYYLLSLILFLLLMTDAHKWFSVKNVLAKQVIKSDEKEGLIFKLKGHAEKWLASTHSIPKWQVLIFRLQLVIVYFFGAIAKMNKDWFNGFPMKIWLPGKEVPFFSDWLYLESTAYFFSYSGFVLDLVIGFMLLWKRTRVIAVLILLFFHLPNHFIWTIGIFPWFMLGANLLFFEPEWPEKVWAWMSKAPGRFGKLTSELSIPENAVSITRPSWRNSLSLGFFFVFLAWQILFPLRGHLVEGNTAWTGIGDNFSWRMMLIDRTSAIKMLVDIPGRGNIGAVDINKYVTNKQFGRLSHSPGSFIRFAKFLEKEMKVGGLTEDPEIKAHIYRSLNGRPYQLLLDSTVNLSAVELSPFRSPECLMPFQDLPYKKDFKTITREEQRALGI